MSTAQAETAKKGKGFFALDVVRFFKIRDAGLGIEEAAAYLALMKGTDQSNVLSRGGINSVSEYTGLTRFEAKRAVGNLARAGIIEALDVERARARTVPRYRLDPHETRAALSDVEAEVVAEVELGNPVHGSRESSAAYRAAQKGWIERRGDGWAIVPRSPAVAFVPNLFVQMSGQVSPLARLVQIGELGPLMLMAEIYHKQDLMAERGVPIAQLSAHFRSTEAIGAGAEPSGYRLHWLEAGRQYEEGGEVNGFDKLRDASAFNHPGDDFWRDLALLSRAHVIEWAIYSANGKPGSRYQRLRPQRPLGVLRNGKQVRDTPESAAALVAYGLWLEQARIRHGETVPPVAEMIRDWLANSPLVAVENAHVEHVEAIGICRAVYRAGTENTAQWFRDLHTERRKALFFLDQARRAAFPEAADIYAEIGQEAKASQAISM